MAMLLSLLANIHRDSKKKPTPYTVEDFMLDFGQAREDAAPTPDATKRYTQLMQQLYSPKGKRDA